MLDILYLQAGLAVQDVSPLMAMPYRWRCTRPRGHEAIRLMDAGYT